MPQPVVGMFLVKSEPPSDLSATFVPGWLAEVAGAGLSLSTDEEEGFFPAMVHPRQVRFTPSAVGGNSDSDSDLNSEPELDERARALRNTLGLSAGYDARVGGERWTGHGDAVSHNRKRGPSRAPTAAPLIGKKELPEIWYPPPEERR